jgi:hypothetical protein
MARELEEMANHAAGTAKIPTGERGWMLWRRPKGRHADLGPRAVRKKMRMEATLMGPGE